jgi:hypothetical protein
VWIAACRNDKPAAADSAIAIAPAPEPAPAPAENAGWDKTIAGPVMLLAVPDNSASVSVVLPSVTDSTLASASAFELDSLSGAAVELFSREGLAGSSTLVLGQQQQTPEGCVVWPKVRLSEVPPKSWRIGFVRGVVVPLVLDSLETMSNSDSTFIVRELARLSSAVAEGDDPAFRGLPFSVRKAFRFALPKTSVVVGDIVRRIPEEANPREEHLLLIAERAATGSDGYSSLFHSRVAGAEDAVRTSEILGAIRFVKGNTAAVVVAFDFADGGRTALVQRVSNSEWRITWRSAFSGC